MKKNKSWNEKLHDGRDLPRVEPITESMPTCWGSGTFVIPAPVEVDELMKRVPRGKVTTMNEIRNALARRHGSDIACPLTTGIFAWVAAHASYERTRCGDTDETPYWRTLKSGGYLNEKYPGGLTEQMERLEAEGHSVIKRGKRYMVAEYQHALAELSDEMAVCES